MTTQSREPTLVKFGALDGCIAYMANAWPMVLGPLAQRMCSHTGQVGQNGNGTDDLGWRISVRSGDDRQHLFLFQRISVSIQRFNAVLLTAGRFSL